MQRKKSGVFYGYWVLLVAFLCQATSAGITYYPFGLFVKPLSDDFGWSRGEIMVGSTIMALVGALLSPFFGRLIRRFGAKKTIAAGAIVLSAGMLLLSRIQTLWQFYLLFFVIGVGTAGMAIVPGSIVVANWFERRRGFAIGILGAGIGVGGFAIPPVMGGVLIPGFGWRTTLVVTGLLPIILIVPLTVLVLREKPSDMGLRPDGATPEGAAAEKKKRESNNPGLDLQTARRTPAFWLVAIAFTAFSIPCMATFSNQVPHLQDIGFPVAAAASAISAVGVGSAAGKFGFGWLCDYMKSKYALAAGIVLQAGAILILMNVRPDSSVALIWLEALMLGLGLGSWLPSMTMTVSSTFGLASYGAIFGFINMLFSLGAAISPVAAGYIFDMQKSYSLVFVLSLVLYAVALPSILLVRRPNAGKTGEW